MVKTIFIRMMIITLLSMSFSRCSSNVSTSSENKGDSGPPPSPPSYIPGSDYSFQIPLEGVVRTYKVHIPLNANLGTRLPVVIVFHGGGGTGDQILKYSRMNEYSDTSPDKFLVVYPDAYLNVWNSGPLPYLVNAKDDVAFISSLIEDLEAKFLIETRKIYATGHSNGSQMVYRLACELSSKITAIAPISAQGIMDIQTQCYQSRPVPILHFHGVQDRCIPGESTTCGACRAEIELTTKGYLPEGSVINETTVTSVRDFLLVLREPWLLGLPTNSSISTSLTTPCTSTPYLNQNVLNLIGGNTSTVTTANSTLDLVWLKNLILKASTINFLNSTSSYFQASCMVQSPVSDTPPIGWRYWEELGSLQDQRLLTLESLFWMSKIVRASQFSCQKLTVLNPISGGPTDPLAGTYIHSWKTKYGCLNKTISQNGSLTSPGTLTKYSSCNSNAEVGIWLINNNGHFWPGGTYDPYNECVTDPNGVKCRTYIKNVMGPLDPAFNANDLMWKFFKKFSL